MIGLVLVTHGRLAAEFVAAMEHVEQQMQRRVALGTRRPRAESGQRRARIGREGGGEFLSGFLSLLAGTGDGRVRTEEPRQSGKEGDGAGGEQRDPPATAHGSS